MVGRGREAIQTQNELVLWALNWPPDMSRLPDSEAARFAEVLPETVGKVDEMQRTLDGSLKGRSSRVPWWILKGAAKEEQIYEAALRQVDYASSIGRRRDDGTGEDARSIDQPRRDEAWPSALRTAIKRAALSPTRGKGMVRDGLRANLVRYVAEIAGLSVSRGADSPPPFRTACDAVALAERIWKRSTEAGEDAEVVAALMLGLLTRTELSATEEIAGMAQEKAERIVREGKQADEGELAACARALDEWLAKTAGSAETPGSAEPLKSAVNILQIWNKEDRVSRATAADVQGAEKLLGMWRAGPGIAEASWDKAVRQLAWLRTALADPEASRPRLWHIPTVEKGMKRQE